MGLLSSAVLVSGGVSSPMPVSGTEMKAVTATAVNADRFCRMIAEIPSDEVEKGDEPSEAAEALYCESEIPSEQELSEETYITCFSEGFDSTFKAYMDYRCITDVDSVQYSLQQQAYTDERGFRRIGDDYCVALGTGITGGCGERFIINLDSGYSFSAIVSDIKADIHTDSTNCYAPRGENAGNIVEFIIDCDNADGYMLSCGSADCFEDLSGNVTSIERI